MNASTPVKRPATNTQGLDQEQIATSEWLTNALTPEALCSAIGGQIPEFRSGQLSLIGCEMSRLRLRDGETFWSGICLLTVADAHAATTQTALYAMLIPEGQPEPEIPSEELPFGSEEWRCYLPALRLELAVQPQGAKLDALAELTDPKAARHLLEESIRSSGNETYRNLRIQSCQPQVMRYKPGSRCTILYHLEYASALESAKRWPAVVVAKTHHGDKGKIAYDGMVALWQSPMRTSSTVTIAEPLAYMAETRVLVQGPIREEMTLKELVQLALEAEGAKAAPLMDELHGYLHKTARGLAELHQCGAHCGEVVSWEDELAEVVESRATLDVVLPDLTLFDEELLTRLQQQASLYPADALAPAHRSFRPAQVLLYQGDIGFIDFDGFCRAEPAMDLALFMTTIKNMARMKSKKPKQSKAHSVDLPISDAQVAQLEKAEALCAFFLAEYEKHAAVSRERIALWESLQLLSLLLGSWKKLKLDRLPYCQFMLQRHLQRHGLA